jgi:tRNA pseudouridine38-40 synthase
MARYQAVVEYDGTDFLGFQCQAKGRTVQGDLEAALRKTGWSGRRLLAAGRTDTGVHAVGQVVAFDLDWRHEAADLLRAWNANLAPDVAVRSVQECASGFDPRRQARGRHYRYTLRNSRVRSPLADRYAWQFWAPEFDVDAMRSASGRLIGRHNFAAFGTDPRHRGSTVRSVDLADWKAEAEWLWFDVRADAFLYRMVRSLVGALKRIGEGRLTADEFERLLSSGDRSGCPPPAPPQGLCLVEVLY